MQEDLGLKFWDNTTGKMNNNAKFKVWKFMGDHCEEICYLKRANQLKSCTAVRRRLARNLPTLWMT